MALTSGFDLRAISSTDFKSDAVQQWFYFPIKNDVKEISFVSSTT